MWIRYSVLGISIVLLIIVLLLGGLYVNSNDTVNASSSNKILKKSAEAGKEIVGNAADALNEISKSVREGINDNPESESSGVQNSTSSILLEVTSLNESASDTRVDNPDMIATKMKFGEKQDLGFDMTIYKLKDQNFVVNNNSRICHEILSTT